MRELDVVIIGAGPAGEAAAHKAGGLGLSVAIADRGWFGGSCPHIGCVPSKSLLHSAAVHHDGGDYPWPRASARRDWMVNRAPDAAEPDDTSHVRSLEASGAGIVRGDATIVGRGRVAVRRGDASGEVRELAARNVVVAVGSRSKVPPIEGLAEARPWTNRDATLARELPRSLLVLGGGPTGCELAQVYARFGVPVTVVQSGPRLVPTEHPRTADVVRSALERDGVSVRTGARAVRVRAGAGRRRGPRRRARRRDDRGGPRDPSRGGAGVPGARARARALRPRRGRRAGAPARRPPSARPGPVGRGRSGGPGAPHAPGALPGRARRRAMARART